MESLISSKSVGRKGNKKSSKIEKSDGMEEEKTEICISKPLNLTITRRKEILKTYPGNIFIDDYANTRLVGKLDSWGVLSEKSVFDNSIIFYLFSVTERAIGGDTVVVYQAYHSRPQYYMNRNAIGGKIDYIKVVRPGIFDKHSLLVFMHSSLEKERLRCWRYDSLPSLILDEDEIEVPSEASPERMIRVTSRGKACFEGVENWHVCDLRRDKRVFFSELFRIPKMGLNDRLVDMGERFLLTDMKEGDVRKLYIYKLYGSKERRQLIMSPEIINDEMFIESIDGSDYLSARWTDKVTPGLKNILYRYNLDNLDDGCYLCTRFDPIYQELAVWPVSDGLLKLYSFGLSFISYFDVQYLTSDSKRIEWGGSGYKKISLSWSIG